MKALILMDVVFLVLMIIFVIVHPLSVNWMAVATLFTVGIYWVLRSIIFPRKGRVRI